MFSEAPELYDAIYGSFKDYEAEARTIATLIEQAAPAAQSVLDIACGTGSHALHLVRSHGFSVHGLDIEPAFVRLAADKVPEASFVQGDMSSFDLGRGFDVVLCLFSSIGYLCDLAEVEAALRCFRAHLNASGVVLVEPWLTPDAWAPGRVYLHTGEDGERQIVRMSHSRLDGRTSCLEFHYLIGGPEGIEHRLEEHSLGLFTREEMMEAFANAGFRDVSFDPEGLIGRGLYTARA